MAPAPLGEQADAKQIFKWQPSDPNEQEGIRRTYLEQRYHKDGLNLGPLLEVAMILETAEAYRLTGDRQRAQILLSDAVENLPGNAMLLDLEQKWLAGEVGPPRWREILLPGPGERDSR